MFHKYVILFLLSPLLYARADVPSQFNSENLLTSQSVTVNTAVPDKKGLVVVFMSAKCPCSDSHIPVLKKLSSAYKDFKFVVIHSNVDETKKEAQKYFKQAALPFDVLQDSHAKIADMFKAFKTPHAFVLNPAGQIVYQGGVTNSSNAPSADKFFLADALADINAGKAVKTPEGRTLGCVIMRESELHAN